jgi:hypothetical protein
MATLAELHPDEEHDTVERLVKGAIARALQPWRIEEQRRMAIERAVDSLPGLMKFDSACDWESKARTLAAVAVAGVRENASAAEMEAAGKEAIKPLIRTYEHNERIESAVRRLFLPDGTSQEQQEAREAVREALSNLPVDASQRQFQQAQDNALRPIRDRIQTRLTTARIESWVPPELSEAERGAAFANANKAIAGLPAGTSNHEQEKVAREVIERQAAKKHLIEEGLREIPRYAQRLRRRYDYDAGETVDTIERRVRREVENQLRKELDGTETSEDVNRLLHDIMKDLEGCTD